MKESSKKKYNPAENAKKRKEELKSITEELQKGIENVFESENYKNYLDTMSKFPSYSFGNVMLIAIQKPGASICQSFTGWKKIGRNVKLGEKGIKILAPCISKGKQKEDLNIADDLTTDNDEKLMVLDSSKRYFKPVSTFDISQTEGEPLPTLGVENLMDDVKNYKDILSVLEDISPVPISFEDTGSAAKGYFNTEKNTIVVAPDMSELQTMKTLVHEMSHAMLHNSDAIKARKEKGDSPTRMNLEVEAESVAYTVCKHFGLDTADYSFGYIAGWSSGKEISELKDNLKLIQKTSSKIIKSFDEKMNEKFVSYSIYQLKDEKMDLHFENSDHLAIMGAEIEKSNYNFIYSGMIPKGINDKVAILEKLFEKFNIDRPDDFKGHSLSVSDVVTLGTGDTETAHFVDSFGYKEVPGFGRETEKTVKEPSKLDAIKGLGTHSDKSATKDTPKREER